ncbi:hypothetical protein L227DRAFT_577549 [Lentinus tigrinus ALCF2SS1-6]|uniref:DUF6533 domain-containing protein n=1 Tax=Lentinus tigrinus ALCF2SS1-6 TaxID=1328759 RepID=A0A5C2S2R2_9APHY|nr:hypothetical protein L227DRAFT_577549 [Lentinus tigrinus ALCF2SS1-6]
MTTDGGTDKNTMRAYNTSFVQDCCVLATTALLWLDWMHMFPAEASRIWGRKFTGTTAVYLLNRYTALAERVIFIVETLVVVNEKVCGILTHADDAVLLLNYIAFAAFTILRVYAVWGRDWKPLVVVVPLSVARPVLFVVTSIFHVAVRGGPAEGCMRAYTLPDTIMTKFETISIATNVASEGIFLVLTWIRTYGIARDCSRLGLHSPLTTLLLRDGTMYFVALFPSKVLSVIADLNGAPTTFWRVWPYFDDALTTCLLCRFLLDLRGVCFADGMIEDDPEATLQFGDVHLRSNIVGTLGASFQFFAVDCQSDIESRDGSTYGCDLSLLSEESKHRRPTPLLAFDGSKDSLKASWSNPCLTNSS